jgi:hypothetical protein
MSEGKGSSNLKKDESKKKVEVPKDDPVADPILELKDMFAQFLISSKDNQSRNRADISSQSQLHRFNNCIHTFVTI